METLRVTTVVGTRPEIIRLSRIIARLDREECIHHTLIHTGQNYDYELSEIFFQNLEIRKPDYFLNSAGENPMETVGSVLGESYRVFQQVRPDALLILGDTNSCLCALSAKRLKIPIFHMEAGNRCFDMRVPEEINRRIVDHISDINLTYSSIAREYLLREGLPPDRVIKVGSPMKEVIQSQQTKIDESQILTKLGLKERDYFVVSVHREENVDSPTLFEQLVKSLNRIATAFEKRLIFSVHPRTHRRLQQSGFVFDDRVELLKPLSFTDYLQLQRKSLAVLSDSGTITEEASLLKFAALNLREAHERPEGAEESPVIMTGLNGDRILQALSVVVRQSAEEEPHLRVVQDYDVDNVSEKVLRILLSYTDYVRRVVWREPG
ncbi:MAG: UDP-N-acetylglucosamine 2-epimerase (non-hydrolyzing) [Candidatus Eremiobacteraeota bacterium]|nr:UDP-N-acetylglucosamine 2-epimerase (non-hydrolyzing) [Candidatus Eremiobacteraeota bacterium]